MSDPSNSGYRLVPLVCTSCGAPIGAEGEDVVYYCSACRNGYRLDPVAGSLRPVEVSFVSLPNRSVKRYLPFWLLPARVRLLQRSVSGGGGSALLRMFATAAPADPGVPVDGIFAVPAFQAPLESALRLALRYSAALPKLGERLGERLTGGWLTVEDAEKLAEFALIAGEVEKPDTLTELRYELKFGEPRLLGVPFVPAGAGLADALFGLPAG